MEQPQAETRSDAKPAWAKPAWHAWEAIVAIAIALLAASVAGVVAFLAIGSRMTAPTGEGAYLGRAVAQLELGATPNAPGLSLSETLVLQTPLWLGLLVFPWLMVRSRNMSFAGAIAFTQKARDIPIGLAAGAAAQLIAMPLLYLALSPLIDAEDLSGPARTLTDRVSDPLGIVWLILIVLVGAPLVEEIFFRGVLFATLRERCSPWLMLAITSLVFMMFHVGQWLQFPGLMLFGVLAGLMYYKTGRLGVAIWTHVGFNAVTVVALLA